MEHIREYLNNMVSYIIIYNICNIIFETDDSEGYTISKPPCDSNLKSKLYHIFYIKTSERKNWAHMIEDDADQADNLFFISIFLSIW